MNRSVGAGLVGAMLMLAAAAASAQSDDKNKIAGDQFDAGVASLKTNDFDGAANHFEAADAAVPSARSLRQAIKARASAKENARAATLAAKALERYPTDDAT